MFDPGTGNRRGAEQIHGFSDSALRLQDPFAVHAADVWRFLTSYELLVAHNAAFDIRFINREMRLSGLPALTRPVYCTMKGYRALDLGGSASLSAVCQHIKLARAGDLHDAIEDAWLAMQIYLWLHGCPLQRRLRRSLPRTPSNLRHPRSAHTMPPDQGPYSPACPSSETGQVERCLLHRLTFLPWAAGRAARRLHPAKGRSRNCCSCRGFLWSSTHAILWPKAWLMLST